MIPGGEFPPPLRLESNVDYIRGILGGTVWNTAVREDYQDARTVSRRGTFAEYQRAVNVPEAQVVSHTAMEAYIAEHGGDYRFEIAPHPVEALRDRTSDNTEVGRLPKKI